MAQRITRLTNEGVAALVAQHPQRLAGLGTVPLQHPELAVAELTRAVDEFGLRGVQVGTLRGRPRAGRRCAGRLLGKRGGARRGGVRAPVGLLARRAARPLLPVQHRRQPGRDRRRAVAHRSSPGCSTATPAYGSSPRTAAATCPRTWAAPTTPGRYGPRRARCAEPPSTYLRRMWFDSLVYTPQALRHLVEAVGADRVVLGSDYPFDMGVTDPVDRLAAAGARARADEQAIRGGNAARPARTAGLRPSTIEESPCPTASSPTSATST